MALRSEIDALRAKQRRNFLSTLLLSQGIPMLLHGDEIARTQRGNNNAYCQDNEISWMDWQQADKSSGFHRKRDRLAAAASHVSAPPLLSRTADSWDGH